MTSGETLAECLWMRNMREMAIKKILMKTNDTLAMADCQQKRNKKAGDFFYS